MLFRRLYSVLGARFIIGVLFSVSFSSSLFAAPAWKIDIWNSTFTRSTPLAACLTYGGNADGIYASYITDDYFGCHSPSGRFAYTINVGDQVCTSPSVFDTATGSCTLPPSTCSAGFQAMTSDEALSGDICLDQAGESCTGTVKSAGPKINGSYAYTVEFTEGNSCATPESGVSSSGTLDAVQPATGCATDSSGIEWCVDQANATNCGTVNGEFVCYDSVPLNGCIQSDTSNICGVNASAPTDSTGTQAPLLSSADAPTNQPDPVTGETTGVTYSTINYYGGTSTGNTPGTIGSSDTASVIDERGTPSPNSGQFDHFINDLPGIAENMAGVGVNTAPASPIDTNSIILTPGACNDSPFALSIKGGVYPFGICSYVPQIRTFLYWLLAFITVVYIASDFFRSTRPEVKS